MEGHHLFSPASFILSHLSPLSHLLFILSRILTCTNTATIFRLEVLGANLPSGLIRLARLSPPRLFRLARLLRLLLIRMMVRSSASVVDDVARDLENISACVEAQMAAAAANHQSTLAGLDRKLFLSIHLQLKEGIHDLFDQLRGVYFAGSTLFTVRR